MRTTLLALTPLLLVACAARGPHAPGSSPGGASDTTQTSSPECLAARLKAVDPLPAKAIPDEVLRKAQSGWVAVSYDVVAGRAQNLKVVSSSPPALYDSYVLRHTGQYTEPTGATVRGCIATTNIRF